MFHCVAAQVQVVAAGNGLRAVGKPEALIAGERFLKRLGGFLPLRIPGQRRAAVAEREGRFRMDAQDFFTDGHGFLMVQDSLTGFAPLLANAAEIVQAGGNAETAAAFLGFPQMQRHFQVRFGGVIFFGGVLMGAGLAIIFLRGSTTGGTDIISFLVKKWYPHVPIGRMIMVVDCIIIGVSVLVFGNLESALYGLISLYCCSMVIDSIIYGLDKGSMVMVVSEKNDEIAAQIMDELERGVTLLKGQGAYTGTDRDVLMCAVRKQQFARVRAIIYEKDPNAFVIVSETSEVLGEGFKQVSGL